MTSDSPLPVPSSEERALMLDWEENDTSSPGFSSRNQVRADARKAAERICTSYAEGTVTLEELINKLTDTMVKAKTELKNITGRKKTSNYASLQKLAAEVKNPFITLGDKGDTHSASAPKDPSVKGIGGHSYTPKIGESGEKGDIKPAKAPAYPSAEVKAKNESKLLGEYMTPGEAGDIIPKPHDFSVSEHNSPDSKATALAITKDAPHSKKAFPLVWDVLPVKENQRMINAAFSDVLDCLKLIAVRANVDLTTSELGKAYKTIEASAVAYRKASETSLTSEQKAVDELQKAKESVASALEHEQKEVKDIQAEHSPEEAH